MSESAARERDQLVVPRLTGAAWRHAPAREPTEAETAAAVGELREIAGGRGDLLAEVAGLLIGYYRRTAEEPRARAAAYYCMAAGAGLELIPRWIEVGYARAAAARLIPPARSAERQVYAWPEAV
ncbi:MAG TPA: hypothetical protein VGS06_43080 [Streptosporangiaceae bacterium]|nr:hypothetical protein [Streptosporangiaceae bacterium]